MLYVNFEFFRWVLYIIYNFKVCMKFNNVFIGKVLNVLFVMVFYYNNIILIGYCIFVNLKEILFLDNFLNYII